MHILATTHATLDDLIEPIDLKQTPADVVALSFTDSDLSGLSAAWGAEATSLPSLRLASLRDLRHPLSVDLWIDSIAVHARVILVRLLGGHDWWRYGCERLAALARERGIALALLPGECREEDLKLVQASTLPREELDRLLAYFREGGPDNMRALTHRLAGLAGYSETETPTPAPVAKAGFYRPGEGVVDLGSVEIQMSRESKPSPRFPPSPTGRVAGFSRSGGDFFTRAAAPSHDERLSPHPSRPKPRHPPLAGREGAVTKVSGCENSEAQQVLGRALADAQADAAVVPILFYRSMLLAGDVAPIDALFQALSDRGLASIPIFVAGLKDAASLGFVEEAMRRLSPSLIVTTTAFASSPEPGAETLFDRVGAPVLQAVVATTRREAWAANQRGLAPADLAMHVVMPELDGRILAGAIGFKAENALDEALGFRGLVNRAEPDRIDAVADRIARLLRLRRTPRRDRRVVVLIPDYPSAPGRTGYAVGLDVPASVLAMLHDLSQAGYAVGDIPTSPRALLDRLEEQSGALRLHDYDGLCDAVPSEALRAIRARWGEAEKDESVRDGAFRFRAVSFGNVTVALAPDRGRSSDRRADYHDPTVPPRHALLAFGLWLRGTLDCHAIVHVGAHGTLEWLPGKTVALSRDCFPEIVIGPLPVIYPFIVSNPGEAAQAKRRIAAVTLGHLPPPLTGAGLTAEQRDLERLVDEYAQADGLDRRRRDRLAGLILEKAAATGLAVEAGVAGDADPNEALRNIDAWLCDLKDFAIKDGLHIYGREAERETDPLRSQCASAERTALIAALDGKHITAGPSGAPARGRRDVLPTGRNLYTADPRTMPTATAFYLGRLAADEVVRRYRQDHGDYPRSIVIDLWGSASLRTGGEEIAQGLALMGCRPIWDPATGRVTSIEVLPPAVMGRPRVDVTWRISGLFRDLFPTQIALLDASARAVAARSEDAEDNPLADAARAGGVPSRIFGSSPGTYGAGVEDMLAGGNWRTREEIGEAYLEASSHVFGGAEGEGRAEPGAFAQRVAGAELLVHTGDDPARDILEGSADVAFMGGFAAAVAALGSKADLIALDTTDPTRPRARSLAEAVTRTVRARAINPRFIEGQLRHGPRGASEFAETVDRLIGFAETTNAIPSALIDAVHDAYLGDARVRTFLLRENPEAARFIAERFAGARRRGLWHPRRNAVDHDLNMLIAETEAPEQVPA